MPNASVSSDSPAESRTTEKLASQSKNVDLLQSRVQPECISSNRKRRLVLLASAVAVFALSLAIRLYHNLNLDFRVWFFEDAQNYLNAGASVYQAFANGPVKAIDFILQDMQNYSGEFAALTSTTLVDRVSIDGPVFPSYLAILEKIAGLDPANPQFGSASTLMATANSILDSISCLLILMTGTLAFGAAAGVSAGFIAALYPAFIVNTQWCMSETFSVFMISSWLLSFVWLARSPGSILRGSLSGLILGITMLTKPIFIYLLPLAILCIAAFQRVNPDIEKNQNSPSRSSRIAALVAMLVATMIAVSPWLAYTNAAYGKPSLGVQRAPIYNLVVGNTVTEDGWISLPHRTRVPATTLGALEYTAKQFMDNPLGWISLQLKKPVRLWSGAWNDAGYTVAGLNPKAQDVFHQFLLLLAFSWVVFLLADSRIRYNGTAAFLTLASSAVVGLHCMYLAVSALTRYNLTAMPAVILLAGAAVAYLWNLPGKEESKKAIILQRALCLAAPLVTLALLLPIGMLPGILTGFLPSGIESSATLAGAATSVLFWVAVAILLDSFCRNFISGYSEKNMPALVLFCGFGIVAVSHSAFIGSDRTAMEWSCKLEGGQSISQSIVIPTSANLDSPVSLIALDLQDSSPLPLLNIKVGEYSRMVTPQPLYTVQTGNDEIIQSLKYQGRISGHDFRSEREWYGIPIPTEWLRKGSENKVVVTNASRRSTLTVYGDFVDHEAEQQTLTLPSLFTHSWHKAVNNAERRSPLDARVYKTVEPKGAVRNASYFDGVEWYFRDLSSAFGEQRGIYRLRLLLAPSDSSEQNANLVVDSRRKADKVLQRVTVVADGQPIMVNGGNPTTMFPAGNPYVLEAPLPKGAKIRLSARLESQRKEGSASITVTIRDASGKEWVVSSCPSYIPTGKEPRRVTIEEELPEWLTSSSGLSASIMLSPFHEDMVFTNPKRAARRGMKVEDLSLTVLDPKGLTVDRQDLRNWVLY